MCLLFLWVLAICSLVAGVPSRHANYVVHEKRAVEPVNWVKTGRLEADRNITIRIGLAQQNLHQLEEALMSVAHPDSQTYGQHWSPKRVAEHFAPSEATISTVKSWLIDTGFHPDQLQLSRSKGWISVKVHVSEAESLLKAEYHVYRDPLGHEQIGCESYSVPEDIREHVDLIRPTVHFFHHDSSKSPEHSDTTLDKAPTFNHVPKTPSLDDCDKFITPQCLRKLYSIDYKPEVPQLNSLGILEFTPQAYLGSDLDLFFSRFSMSQEKRRPVLASIDGGFVQQQNQSVDYNEESDLDLEYAMTLTDPMPVTVLQTGDLFLGAGFDNWLDAVDGSFCKFEGGDDPNQDGIYPDPQPGGYNHSESCGIIAPPKVVSASYAQDEFTATPAYARRQCDEYGKLGLMGTTVLYGSGDDGVAGANGTCLGPRGVGFSPIFPATCPFVIAVGATQINPNSTVYEPESACEERAHSGGGFSNIFPMPLYQKDAVRGYLEHHPPPYTAERYNNTGRARAYPDLSANGANFVIARNGHFSLAYGTSASVQVVGAILALINDARLAHGKSTVGFINPLIYNPHFSCAFHDITTGSNPGCGTPGFTAAKGWDPVTGVGTPNTAALLDMLLLLP